MLILLERCASFAIHNNAQCVIDHSGLGAARDIGEAHTLFFVNPPGGSGSRTAYTAPEQALHYSLSLRESTGSSLGAGRERSGLTPCAVQQVGKEAKAVVPYSFLSGIVLY